MSAATVTTEPRRETRTGALALAHGLVDMGVPVFAGRLKPDGDPDRTDRRWDNWQSTKPDHAKVDEWRPGMALCAVTGVLLDVLDVDPRNGGIRSLRVLMNEALGGELDYLWSCKTPSGGSHYWLPALGIGTRPGFLPGLDLKGGLPDGGSRGFVFIPPTVRPSKAAGPRAGQPTPYRWVDPVVLNGHRPSVGPLAAYVAEKADRPRAEGKRRPGAVAELRRAARSAGPGEQRAALLALVYEWERMGCEPAEIVEQCAALKLTDYNPRKPWTVRDFEGLLHKPGVVIGDASPAEAAELDGVAPRRGSGLRRASDITREKVHWIWAGYLARRALTVQDGEKGQGKSLVTIDVVARASRGDEMPDGARISGPMTALIFADEDYAASILVPRLMAAKADLSMVCLPPEDMKVRRGKAPAGYLLPDGAAAMGALIREAAADIVILDPVTDFLDETINSHNDASVRRALRPLIREIQQANCALWAIRHMNKDKGQDAKFRGTGSSAFQNRARVHLITGEVPSGYPGEGTFAIRQVDTNLTARNDSALVYSIVDSDIEQDDDGNYVARLEWHGTADISANSLTQGQVARRGPEPHRQEELSDVLSQMFDGQDTWKAHDVKAELKKAGASTDSDTLRKVCRELGIERRARYKESGGIDHWIWTTATEKVRVRRRG